MDLFPTIGNWIKYAVVFVLINLQAAFAFVVQYLEPHQKLDVLPRRSKQVAIVTGGSRGIGLEVVKQLMSSGMHVIIASRNATSGKSLLDHLNQFYCNAKVEAINLDLSSFKSIHKFAEEFLSRNYSLHLLINNAGIMFGPHQLTEDKIESQFGTNYLGHFLLTKLLLPKLKATGTKEQCARIVNVSSCIQSVVDINFDDLQSMKSYSTYFCYCQSKLAQVMFSVSLQALLSKHDCHVTINSLHPGVIFTDLYKYVWYGPLLNFIFHLVAKKPKEGADSIIYLAFSKDLEGKGGMYFDNCSERTPNSAAQDEGKLIRLWVESCKLVNVDSNWDLKP